jgi:hypothetical protein
MDSNFLVGFDLRKDYLLVKGFGTRDSNASVLEATLTTYKKIKETGSKYLLVDYSEVQIKLDHVQAFNLIRTYETNLPQLGTVTAACVFNEEAQDFALYWQQIGRQRGFDIFLFETLEQAETWLLQRVRLSA